MIGLYCPDSDYSARGRVASILYEAERLGSDIICFDATSLDCNSFTILGSVYKDGIWHQQRVPLPSAVICSFMSEENRLSPEMQWLGQHTAFIAMDIPVSDEELGIRFLELPHMRTLVEPWNEDRIHSHGNGSLNDYTHFRITMIRSSEGNWMAEKAECLRCTEDPQATEASTGTDISLSIRQKFAHAHTFIESHLKHIASEIGNVIETMSLFMLPCFYVDLDIDLQNRTWFCGTGISTDDTKVSEVIAFGMQLLKMKQNMPIRHLTPSYSGDGPTIGMMVGWSLSPLFLEACQHVAASNGARFFYFYPKQVDFEKKQIRGSYWRDGQWMKALFPFPDVIYDRMRRKNTANAKFYEALSPIPITHNLRFGVLNKIKVYQMIATVPELRSALIPFQLLQNLDKAKAFIDCYPNFILKPFRGSNGENMITVNHIDGHYEVFDQYYVHTMSRIELDQLLAALQPKDYFVQQLVESKTKEGYPFHIRVHLMKDRVGNWTIVFILPSLSLTPYRKITNHKKTFRGITKWEWFINRQFGEKTSNIIDRKVKKFAFKLANFLENWLGAGFHEIGLDLGMDEHGTIKLFEANLNNVGMNFHEFEAAKHGIEYSLFLASGN